MSDHPNWRALATINFPRKHFVRESSVSNENNVNVPSACIFPNEESKAVYEEILSLPSQLPEKCVKRKKIEKPAVLCKPAVNKPLNINTLMKEASNNNVQALVGMLNDDSDVNVTDQFGWTMLMCACHAGAIDVVQYLLEKGADINMRDKTGLTCKSIARRQRHQGILEILQSLSLPEKVCDSQPEETQIFCEICKQNFKETSEIRHSTSTVHLFNSHPRCQRTFYSIPEHNKGYELLIKTGWKREEGLGPSGSGKKFPPKTILKRDRKGIGCDKGTARVTHFKPYDTSAVASRFKTKEKISRKKQVENERRKERRLRRELNF